MRRPKDEAGSISMAMGYCPECQTRWVSKNNVRERLLHLNNYPCVSDGHEYQCNAVARGKRAKAYGSY